MECISKVLGPLYSYIDPSYTSLTTVKYKGLIVTIGNSCYTVIMTTMEILVRKGLLQCYF